jgi:RHH-type transcriptional regulator, proline utilization regulon repressor / proline dehydrogenase / delta 1-pyrroline-5-carboxylate dehydrogenase
MTGTNEGKTIMADASPKSTYNRLSAARLALRQATHMEEAKAVKSLLAGYPLDNARREEAGKLAHKIVTGSRAKAAERGTLDAFMQEFGLANDEGVALMCLAEALLRIPDVETQDKLIAEKMIAGDWSDHRGRSDSTFVNASVWALMLTGTVVKLDKAISANPARFMKGLVARVGEPVIREATNQAMKIMGRQFVFGRDMKAALVRKAKQTPNSLLYSFDMLGEGARTMADARRYMGLYRESVIAVGEDDNGKGSDHRDKSGVSIKLSALHPRYQQINSERVMTELLPDVKELALLAKGYNMGLTIDAEEVDRLDISLEIIEAIARDPELAGWDGFGLAVQAYQKRAIYVIDWLIALAAVTGRKFAVRLVKGAYWDSEIKHAQELGLADYPVFTRKASTDVSYITAAAKMLANPQAFYPQFATHNALTLATIAQMAKKGADGEPVEMEFQRIHGMGDLLYNSAEDILGERAHYRTYAPVGLHADLLPYLVRRLLENGANSSFVNRFMDAKVPIEEIVRDPYTQVQGFRSKRHNAIPLPADLYRDRKNSAGIDLANPVGNAILLDAVKHQSKTAYTAPSLIAGKELGGEGQAVTSPTDQTRIVGTARYASPDEIEMAITSAAASRHDWNMLGGAKRAGILERMADLIEENRVVFFDLLTREAGKTLEDGVSEVREAADFCRFYAKEAREKFDQPITLDGPTGELNQLSLHGRGIFFCISPWNFPLAIFVGQVAAALAAGNSVLAKAAEQTPLVAAQAVRLFFEAGVPVDVLHLIIGKGSALGRIITPDSRVTGFALTGSTATAKIINKQLADKDGPINIFIAETGGQNAMIADSSALPEQVVDDVIRSAFSSAGQRCSALRVLYIQDDIADEVIEMLKGAVAELSVGDPALLSTDVGPVIDKRERDGLLAHIERMHKEATFIARANEPEGMDAGAFLAPHIFEIPALDILKDEEFGPILHVLRYKADDLDGVMKDIVATGYGLTFGVHSRIEGRWVDLFDKHRVGNTYVNRNMIGAVVGVQPFGGQGLSGTGPKAGGPHYLYRFATERVISINTAAIGGNTGLFQLDESGD